MKVLNLFPVREPSRSAHVQVMHWRGLCQQCVSFGWTFSPPPPLCLPEQQRPGWDGPGRYGRRGGSGRGGDGRRWEQQRLLFALFLSPMNTKHWSCKESGLLWLSTGFFFFLFMREHLSVVPICRVTKRSSCFLLRVVDATFLSVPRFKVVKIIWWGDNPFFF